MPTRKLTEDRVARIVRAMPSLMGLGEGQSSGEISRAVAEPHDDEEFAWQDLIDDYYRAMEIAHYVRRGGVKAMIYRVETGRTTFVPSDYFDEAQVRIASAFQGTFVHESSTQPILERLQSISSEEEEAVQKYLPEIDEILLSEKRKDAAVAEE